MGNASEVMRDSAKVCGVCVRQKNGGIVWNRVDSFIREICEIRGQTETAVSYYD